MGRIALVVLAAGLLSATAGCGAVSPRLDAADGTERTISVSGTGTVSAVPDQATVRLGVETTAEAADEALRRNNERMQAVIDRLEEVGIPSADLQTETVEIRPQYQRPEGEGPDTGKRTLADYVVNNTVRASRGDVDAVGEVLDAAVEAGANRVEGISFEVSNPGQVVQRAREAAWEDAEQKADQLANLSGAELGDVASIDESREGLRPVYAAAEVEQEAAVPIEPGSEEIRVQLQVTWMLR